MPVLYYRILPSDALLESATWQECLQKPKRHLASLLFNPDGNLFLTSGSLVNQLQQDIEDLDETKKSEFTESVSYQLVKSLVTFNIRKHHSLNQNYRFQFKLSLVQPNCGNENYSAEEVAEDVLISPVHEV